MSTLDLGRVVGPQGLTGKSAYQYAVEGGFPGTEEEFAQFMAKTPGADEILLPDGTSVLTALSNKADAIPPEWYDFPFDQATFKATGYAKYCKDQFGFVTVEFSLQTIDRGTLPNGTLLGTLPVGFRPRQNLASIYFDSNKNALSYQLIRIDGNIVGYGYTSNGFSNVDIVQSFYPA